MDLEKLAELSIGLAASVGVLWIVLLMIRELRKKDGDGGNNGASGQMPISYWRQEIRKVMREELELWDRGRLEKFRAMIREELRDK